MIYYLALQSDPGDQHNDASESWAHDPQTIVLRAVSPAKQSAEPETPLALSQSSDPTLAMLHSQ